ncbi:MAG: GIY-YIG nuclease family protein [Anaerolineales bacterium]|nr:GIY-YIG nuclease family protein [Anaerolineales bacterium]
MPFVYIVRCADGTLYTGWAVDVARRVKLHNAGRGARYTAAHRPVELVYSEEVASRAAALKRELVIKSYPRAKKLALCAPPAPPKRRRKPKTSPPGA